MFPPHDIMSAGSYCTIENPQLFRLVDDTTPTLFQVRGPSSTLLDELF